MNRTYGFDPDYAYDNAHDPQMRPAPTERGMCLMCGELFPMEELDRNGGLCLPCYYKSLEPDPNDGELFEGETRETDSSAPRADVVIGPYGVQNDEKGGGDDGGKG